VSSANIFMLLCTHSGRSFTNIRNSGRIVVTVHAGKRGRVISRYASHC